MYIYCKKISSLVFFLVLLFSIENIYGKDIFNSVKLRGGFMDQLDMGLLPKMSESGMNVALVAFRSTSSPLRHDQRKNYLKWGNACKRAELYLMPYINYWHDEGKWFRPDFYYYTDATEFYKTPCPLASDSYNSLIHNRFISLARLSHTIPIIGAVLDTEMYSANFLAFTYLCYCDDCWRRFCQVYPEYVDTPRSKRESYIKRIGKAVVYKDFAVKRLSDMTASTRREIDEIAPGFRIGVAKLDQLNWFTEGLAKGFGSGDNPVIIFSLRTYIKGYTSYIPKTIDKFKKMGINARFAAGIWQDKFPIENLPEQYYYCAKNSEGYWIYTLQALNPKWRNPTHYEVSDYWNAMKIANKELDKLEANPDYESDLKIHPFRTMLDPIKFRLHRTEDVRYVSSLVNERPVADPILFIGINKLIFIAKQGELIRFQIKFTKMPFAEAEHVENTLLSRNGMVLVRAEATVDKNAVIEAIAPYSGTYAIIVNSDKNNASVVGFTHPFSFYAGQWPQAHLMRAKGPIYLWKPVGSKSARIYCFSDGVAEAVIMTFRKKTGELVGRYTINARLTITIPFAYSVKDEIIVLTVEPVEGAYFEDVWITIEDGLGKYISQFESGLVKSANR